MQDQIKKKNKIINDNHGHYIFQSQLMSRYCFILVFYKSKQIV